MPNYRRAREGRTYFFTVVTYERRPVLCDTRLRAALRESIAETRRARPFVIDAWVLLPDHLHCIWTLPREDADYSTRWGLIKAGVTRRLAPTVKDPAHLSPSRQKHREAGLWQRRFWEHTVRDEKDFESHCDYIHWNPVRHGLVSTPGEWPFSTFRRFLKDGLYPNDWGSAPPGFPDDIGGE